MGMPVSIIMPAYKAGETIAASARSVLAQSHEAWELVIVADDGDDYEMVLARQRVTDPRIKFLSTGKTGSGSSPARNVGIDAAQYRHIAILDADDLFHPDKLALCANKMMEWGIVSCALQVTDNAFHPLRTVGAGPDKVLNGGDYKFTNLSMDSMILYDRHKSDPRYDPDFPCLTDIEFLLKLFAHTEAVFHFGTPLHTYVKQPLSVSNKPGASNQMIETKERLLDLFVAGRYPMADPEGVAGMQRFYESSLAAEQSYGALLAQNPALLFEDHLEPILKAARV